MHYKTIKLDRRHAWHQDFVHMIEFEKRGFFQGKLVNNSGVLEFDRGRRWFNNTFGWSRDVETRQRMLKADSDIHKTDEYNKKWSWSIAYDEYRIYVASDAELNWFVLAHTRVL